MDIEKKDETLTKGEALEEQLRAYFLELGYYVVRGSKFKFLDVEVTDIDLWLYHRTTPIARERVNVDIKNKVRPNAVERIIVAKGIMNILQYDRCIVATTDKREDVVQFGEKNGVRVLNGNFLNKIRGKKIERLTEEDLYSLLKNQYSKLTTNWVAFYENAKSRMLDNADFVVANFILDDIKDVLQHVYSNQQMQESLLRLLYILISNLYIAVDFLLKDMAFIEAPAKNKNLEEGFRYGVVGENNIKVRLESIAPKLGRTVPEVISILSKSSVDILRDFFGSNDVAKKLFSNAKEFENIAFSKEFSTPSKISAELRGALGLLCDFSNIDRKLILSL
jgi:hypothetical protein